MELKKDSKEPQTLEEYKELVSKLKNKIRRYEKKTAELMTRLTEKSKNEDREIREKILKQSMQFQKNLVKVQALWRGYKARKEFKNTLKKLMASSLGKSSHFRLISNDSAIKHIYDEVSKLGLNMEMLFRACDVKYKGEVFLEDFKMLMRKLKIKIPQAKLNRFFHMIDEDCTGIIKLDEYKACLAAFSVNSERQSGASRTFEQEVLIKFSDLLEKKRITPQEVSNFCDPDHAGYIKTTQLQKFIINMNEPFKEKEIFALLKYLDVENNTYIDKDYFINTMKAVSKQQAQAPPDSSNTKLRPGSSSTKALPKDSRATKLSETKSKDTEIKKREPEVKSKPADSDEEASSFNPKKKLKEFFGFSKGKKEKPQDEEQIEENSNVADKTPQEDSIKDKSKDAKKLTKKQVSEKLKSLPKVRNFSFKLNQHPDNDQTSLKRTIVKCELADHQIYKFLEELLSEHLIDLKKGITTSNISIAWDKVIGKICTQEEKAVAIKGFEANKEGVVDFRSILSFIVNCLNISRERIVSPKLVLLLIAKYAENKQKSTSEFLKSLGIDVKKTCPLKKFEKAIGSKFDFKSEESEEIFTDFDFKQTGVVDVPEIIKYINSFRNDMNAPYNQGEQQAKPAAENQPKANSAGTKNAILVVKNNVINANVANDPKEEWKVAKKIVVKMEITEKPVYKFLETALLAMKNPTTATPSILFEDLLEKMYGNLLDAKEKKFFVGLFDNNTHNGIDLKEIQIFFSRLAKNSKEKVLSTKLLLIYMAKSAQASSITTDAFLLKYKLITKKRYTLDQFIDNIAPLFDLDDDYIESQDLFSECNYNDTGYIDLDHLISQIDAFRCDIDKDGWVDSNIKRKNAEEAEMIKTSVELNTQNIVNPSVEQAVRSKRFDEEEILKAIRDAFDKLNINPIEFFNECSEGNDECDLVTISNKIQKKTDIPQADVWEFMKIMDLNKNGFLDRDEFRVLLMNENNLDALKSSPYKIKAQDLESLIKFKSLLETKKMTPRELFDRLDKDSNGSITILELKNGLNTYFPNSKLSSADIVKIMKAFDADGNGSIEYGEWYSRLTDTTEDPAPSDDQNMGFEVEHVMQGDEAFNTPAKGPAGKPAASKNPTGKPATSKNPTGKPAAASSRNGSKNPPGKSTDSTKNPQDKSGRRPSNTSVNKPPKKASNSDNSQPVGGSSGNDNGPDELKTALLKLKSVLSDFIMNGLKPEDLFVKFDLNQNGEISRDEFLEALDSLDDQVSFTEREKVLLLKVADRKRQNTIPYSDFITLLRTMDISDSSSRSQQQRGQTRQAVQNQNQDQDQGQEGEPDNNEEVDNQARDNNNNNNNQGIAIESKKPKNDDIGISRIDPKIQAQKKQVEEENLQILLTKLQEYSKKYHGTFKNFIYNFRNADIDQDGILTNEEFKNFLDRLKLGFNETDKNLLLKNFDKDGNGSVDFDEFNDFLKSHSLDQEENAQENKEENSAKKPVVSRNTIRKGATFHEALNMEKEDIQAIENELDQIMSKFEIKPQDYFKGTTILNSQLACLRRCYQIIKELEANQNFKFDDPDFGPKNPNDKAIESIYFDEPLPGYPEPEAITWCRLTEICDCNQPHFFDEGCNTNDVIQGALGDCWFIGALSVIASEPQELRGEFNPTPENCKEITDEEVRSMEAGVYPPIFHFLRQYGIYVFKFFKNYQWRYVIVDDKLPCYVHDQGAQLVFARCKNSHEFWVPLIEKAFAKIHGCYEALIAGDLDDALTDMTGHVSYKIKIKAPNGSFNSSILGDKEAFWKKLMDYNNSPTMMGCSVKSIPGQVEHEVEDSEGPIGILRGHAYAIIDVLEIPNPTANNSHKSHRLLRIRNPWGTKEWNGPWSDGSPKLMENIDKINKYVNERSTKQDLDPFDPEADDGTFLMPYKRWREIYDNLFCCIKFDVEWSGIRFKDAWTAQTSGGTPTKPDENMMKNWANNPQYRMTLKNTKTQQTSLFISLGQEDGRLLKGLKYPFKENINPACFTVCKLNPNEDKLLKFDPARVIKLSSIREYRSVELELKLPNGNYLIVPSTQSPGQVGPFFLNVYYSCDTQDIQIKRVGAPNIQGAEIEEESEKVQIYDENIKRLLKFKASSVIYNENQMQQSLIKKPAQASAKKVDIQALRKQVTQLGTSQDDADFAEYMANLTISDEDYAIPGKTTILTNYLKTLKKCEEIIASLKAEGKVHWCDPDFGPQGSEDKAVSSIYYDEPLTGYPDPEAITWCRPYEIRPGTKPLFIDDDASSNDVIQGQLGDCWLIGGMSVLATEPLLLKGDFDPTPENLATITDEEVKGMTIGVYTPIFHYLRKHSIYVFRFFKNYQWIYVIIDDRLPCYKSEEDSQLVFAKCKNPDEYWVPLLEKAYAKLHNCYEALIAGCLDDGLTDMTGLIQQKLKIQGPKGFPGPSIPSSEWLWQFLLENARNRSMMGCSVDSAPGQVEHEVEIDGENVGILRGHAYSILDVLEVPAPEKQVTDPKKHKSYRLLRIRNPWGQKEWTGKWSDSSPKLKLNEDKVLKIIKAHEAIYKNNEDWKEDADDGTFLMCFKDWRNIYSNLFLAKKFPTEWSGYRYNGSWTEANSGGLPMKPTPEAVKSFGMNPQYRFKLRSSRKKTKLFISLGQPDGRMVHGLKYPFKENIQSAICLIFKVTAQEYRLDSYPSDNSKLIGQTVLKQYREVSLSVELENGNYIIVPATAQKGQYGKYYLSVYFECAKKEIEFDNKEGDYIAEEEEESQQFPDELKRVLKVKAALAMHTGDYEIDDCDDHDNDHDH